MPRFGPNRDGDGGADGYDGASDRDRPSLVLVQEAAFHDRVRTLEDLAKVLSENPRRPLSDELVERAVNKDVEVGEATLERVRTLAILTATFDQMQDASAADAESADEPESETETDDTAE